MRRVYVHCALGSMAECPGIVNDGLLTVAPGHLPLSCMPARHFHMAAFLTLLMDFSFILTKRPSVTLPKPGWPMPTASGVHVLNTWTHFPLLDPLLASATATSSIRRFFTLKLILMLQPSCQSHPHGRSLLLVECC